jgi:hypothetical protein
MRISLNWLVKLVLEENIYKNKYLVSVKDEEQSNTYFISKDGEVYYFMDKDLSSCFFNKNELKDYSYYNNCLVKYCEDMDDGIHSWRSFYNCFGEFEEIKVEDFIEDNLNNILYYYKVKNIEEFKEKYNNVKLLVNNIIKEELLLKNNYSSINDLKYKINNIIIEEFKLKENYHCEYCLKSILGVLFK